MRSGNKADLLKYLESKNHDIYITDIFQADVAVIDGAALVNMSRPDPKSTFHEYVKNKILPSISKILSSVTQVDIIFDVYRDDSLKNLTGIHRGEGVRCRVRDTSIVPKDWKSFLRHSENKTERLVLIARICHANLKLETKTVIITIHDHVLCWPNQDTSNIDPCNHEEADTRRYRCCSPCSLCTSSTGRTSDCCSLRFPTKSSFH